MRKSWAAKMLTMLVFLSLPGTASARDILLRGPLSISADVTLGGKAIGVSGLRIEDNTALSLHLYLLNTAAEPRSIQAVLSIYNGDGTLKTMKATSGTAYQNNELTLTLSHTFSAEADNAYGKLLLWDTFGRIAPLTGVIDFHKNTIYFYDVNNRLLLLQKAGGEALRFTYDDNGNLKTKYYEQ